LTSLNGVGWGLVLLPSWLDNVCEIYFSSTEVILLGSNFVYTHICINLKHCFMGKQPVHNVLQNYC